MLRFFQMFINLAGAPETSKPEKFKIAHDDCHAKYIGLTAEGRQFFLSNLFEPAYEENPGKEFVALFLFDSDGSLVEDRIDDFGTRAEMGLSPVLPGNKIESNVIEDTLQKRLAEMGDVQFCDIEIKPFEIERFGQAFGFIPQAPEDPNDEDDHWCIELHPGNFMAFYPPWDGDYDT